MTFEEFKHDMNRLIDAFGEKAFAESKVALIFNKVKTYTASHWSECVDYMILNSRYSPLMKDIEAAKEATSRGNLKDNDSQIRDKLIADNGGYACTHCDSFGFIVTKTAIKPGAPYAFRCDKCQAANLLKLSKEIPMWNEFKYQIHTILMPCDI